MEDWDPKSPFIEERRPINYRKELRELYYQSRRQYIFMNYISESSFYEDEDKDKYENGRDKNCEKLKLIAEILY